MQTFMLKLLFNIFSDKPGSLNSKITGILSILIIYNIIAWLWAYQYFHAYPILLSTAVLAYTFGLRHAVDADHIAAIDNVTRKLMQEKKQPATSGLFFSLGHSSVVIIASAIVALATSKLVSSNYSHWHDISSIVCTTISATFLLLIATLNLIIFISIFKTFKEVRAGKVYREHDVEEMLNNRGFLIRRFRRFFKFISSSWQMFPLGFLFGIGFDTATEITLLGITASQAMHGMSITAVLIFPALFAAGMTLVDSLDCFIMLGAYGWAFMKPIRKLYYNMTITIISVMVAFLIGSIEVLGLIGKKFDTNSSGWIWPIINTLNEHSNSLGYIIIIVFVVSWLGSILMYRLLAIENLETDTLDCKSMRN